MNKIFKIIIKKDPIFKFIVEDYPFYEGIFFHCIDFHNMNILSSHYFLRQNLSINLGKTEIFCIPTYFMHLTSIFDTNSPKLLINPRFKMKSNAKFYTLNVPRIHIRLNVRLKIHDKSYYKSTANLHMITLIRLKTHDPYLLENRDILTLSDMDGEKFL